MLEERCEVNGPELDNMSSTHSSSSKSTKRKNEFPFGQMGQTSQLCGEKRIKEVQATDLIESSRTLNSNGREGMEQSNQDEHSFDARFRVHPSPKFSFGRVFMVLWSEPRESGGTQISKVQSSTTACTKIRRFMIIKAGNGHSTCIPIFTYFDRGVSKPGVYAENHSGIYTSNSENENRARISKYDMAVQTKHHDGLIGWWKCCQRAREVDPELGESARPDDRHEQCGICKAKFTSRQVETGSRSNCVKMYTVEHDVKVCFTGHFTETNVERLLCRNISWEASDTGELFPVIMEDKLYPGLGCRCGRFNLCNRTEMSNKMIALLGLSSGLLMSSSFVWLNTRMKLYEPSATMNQIIDVGYYWVSNSTSDDKLYIADGMIFAFFVFGAAGLTSTSIAFLNSSRCLNMFSIGMTITAVVASVVLGFNVEELILVCLPIIIGCGILCSSTLRLEATRTMHQKEQVHLPVEA